jgi:hypothetical protein
VLKEGRRVTRIGMVVLSEGESGRKQDANAIKMQKGFFSLSLRFLG